MEKKQYVAIVKIRLTKETVEAYDRDFNRIRDRAERYINNARYYPDKEKEEKEEEVKDNDG